MPHVGNAWVHMMPEMKGFFKDLERQLKDWGKNKDGKQDDKNKLRIRPEFTDEDADALRKRLGRKPFTLPVAPEFSDDFDARLDEIWNQTVDYFNPEDDNEVVKMHVSADTTRARAEIEALQKWADSHRATIVVDVDRQRFDDELDYHERRMRELRKQAEEPLAVDVTQHPRYDPGTDWEDERQRAEREKHNAKLEREMIRDAQQRADKAASASNFTYAADLDDASVRRVERRLKDLERDRTVRVNLVYGKRGSRSQNDTLERDVDALERAVTRLTDLQSNIDRLDPDGIELDVEKVRRGLDKFDGIDTRVKVDVDFDYDADEFDQLHAHLDGLRDKLQVTQEEVTDGITAEPRGREQQTVRVDTTGLATEATSKAILAAINRPGAPGDTAGDGRETTTAQAEPSTETTTGDDAQRPQVVAPHAGDASVTAPAEAPADSTPQVDAPGGREVQKVTIVDKAGTNVTDEIGDGFDGRRLRGGNDKVGRYDPTQRVYRPGEEQSDLARNLLNVDWDTQFDALQDLWASSEARENLAPEQRRDMEAGMDEAAAARRRIAGLDAAEAARRPKSNAQRAAEARVILEQRGVDTSDFDPIDPATMNAARREIANQRRADPARVDAALRQESATQQAHLTQRQAEEATIRQRLGMRRAGRVDDEQLSRLLGPVARTFARAGQDGGQYAQELLQRQAGVLQAEVDTGYRIRDRIEKLEESLADARPGYETDRLRRQLEREVEARRKHNDDFASMVFSYRQLADALDAQVPHDFSAVLARNESARDNWQRIESQRASEREQRAQRQRFYEDAWGAPGRERDGRPLTERVRASERVDRGRADEVRVIIEQARGNRITDGAERIRRARHENAVAGIRWAEIQAQHAPSSPVDYAARPTPGGGGGSDRDRARQRDRGRITPVPLAPVGGTALNKAASGMGKVTEKVWDYAIYGGKDMTTRVLEGARGATKLASKSAEFAVDKTLDAFGGGDDGGDGGGPSLPTGGGGGGKGGAPKGSLPGALAGGAAKVAGIGVQGQMLSGLVGGVAALGGGIIDTLAGSLAMAAAAAKPLVQSFQSLAAAPAMLAGVVAGVATLATAWNGVGDALSNIDDPEAFEEALAELEPAAAGFARAVAEAKPAFDDIADATQQAHFEGWAESFTRMSDAMAPVLEERLPEMASALGDMGTTVMDTIASPTVTSNIDRAFAAMSEGTRNAAPGMADLTESLTRLVTVGAEEALPALGDWFSDVSSSLNEWMTEDRISGWIDTGINAAQEFGSAFSDVWTGVSGVIRGAIDGADAAFGEGGVWGALTDNLERFTSWANSDAGQSSISGFFEGAAETTQEVAENIGKIGGAIGDELIPRFRDFVDDGGIDQIGDIGTDLVTIATDAIGAFEGLLNIIEPIVSGIATISDFVSTDQQEHFESDLYGGDFNPLTGQRDQGRLSQLNDARTSAYVNESSESLQRLVDQTQDAKRVIGENLDMAGTDGFLELSQQIGAATVNIEELRGGFDGAQQSGKATASVFKALGDSLMEVDADGGLLLNQPPNDELMKALNQIEGMSLADNENGTFTLSFENEMDVMGALESVRSEIESMPDAEVEALGLEEIEADLAGIVAEMAVLEEPVSFQVNADGIEQVKAQLEEAGVAFEAVENKDGTWTVSLEGGQQVQAVLEGIGAQLEVIESDGQTRIQITADNQEALAALQEIGAIKDVDGTLVLNHDLPAVQAWLVDIGAAAMINGTFTLNDNVSEVIGRVLSIDGTQTSGQHTQSDNTATTSANIQSLNGQNTSSVHTVSHNANTVLNAIMSLNGVVTSSQHYAVTYASTVASAVGMPGAADGMVTAHADGSVAKFNAGGSSRQAQIADAGDWIVWAEDETGGESYIPHHPAKRKRSTQILAETADIFGYGLIDQFGKPVTRDGTDTGHNGRTVPIAMADGGINDPIERTVRRINNDWIIYGDAGEDDKNIVRSMDRATQVPDRVHVRDYYNRAESDDQRTLQLVRAMEHGWQPPANVRDFLHNGVPGEITDEMRRLGAPEQVTGAVEDFRVPQEAIDGLRAYYAPPADFEHALVTGEPIKDWEEKPSERELFNPASYLEPNLPGLAGWFGEAIAEDAANEFGLNVTGLRDIPLYNMMNPDAAAWNAALDELDGGRRAYEREYNDRYREERDAYRDGERAERDRQRGPDTLPEDPEDLRKHYEREAKRSAEEQARADAGWESVRQTRAARQRTEAARGNNGVTVNQNIGHIVANSAQEAAGRFRRASLVGFENLTGR